MTGRSSCPAQRDRPFTDPLPPDNSSITIQYLAFLPRHSQQKCHRAWFLTPGWAAVEGDMGQDSAVMTPRSPSCSNPIHELLAWHQPRCNTADHSCNDRHWRKSKIYKHLPLFQYSEKSSLIIKCQRFCLTAYLHMFSSLLLQYCICPRLWKSLRKFWLILNSPHHLCTKETPESLHKCGWLNVLLSKQIPREIPFCTGQYLVNLREWAFFLLVRFFWQIWSLHL